MLYRKVNILILITLITFFRIESGFAQHVSVQQTLAYNQKEQWFDKIVNRENTSLINGPEYFIPFPGATTHPFFGSRELTDEELWYDNQRYTNVPLLYDLFSDILILRLRDKNGLFAMIQIDKNKVESFSLYHHHFRKMTNPKSPETGDAYYDILYEGKSIMLAAKRNKTNYVSDGKTEYQLEEKYYFIHNNQWSRLSGTGSYYELMKNQKARITTFIKTQQIKVRKNNEHDMIAIAAFCNSLEETAVK